jgi:hypothetical protein
MCICGELRPACELERRWESSGVVGMTRRTACCMSAFQAAVASVVSRASRKRLYAAATDSWRSELAPGCRIADLTR